MTENAYLHAQIQQLKSLAFLHIDYLFWYLGVDQSQVAQQQAKLREAKLTTLTSTLVPPSLSLGRRKTQTKSKPLVDSFLIAQKDLLTSGL